MGASEGTLSVNSIPAARVIVDGREVGMTPLQKVVLTPGLHNVKVIAGDRVKESTVEILPGDNLRLIKRFESK